MTVSKRILLAVAGIVVFLAAWAAVIELQRPAPVRRPTLAFAEPSTDSVSALVLDDKGLIAARESLDLGREQHDESLSRLRTLLGSQQPSLAALPASTRNGDPVSRLLEEAKREFGGALEIVAIDGIGGSEKEGDVARARALQDSRLVFPVSTLPDPWRAFDALVDLGSFRWSAFSEVVASVTNFEDFQRALTRFNEILGHTFASLFRVGFGFGVAALIGIPLGLALGSFATLNALLNALIQALRPISPIAWLPVATIALGGGTKAAIFLIFLASVFPIAISTAAAVATVDLKYRRSAMNFGVRGIEFARCVLVPATLPSIFTALRVAVGISWLVVVAAEMLGVEQGLGYLVLDARNQLNYDRVVAAMVVIGLIGLVIDLVFRRFERRILERRGLAPR